VTPAHANLTRPRLPVNIKLPMHSNQYRPAKLKVVYSSETRNMATALSMLSSRSA
jgi:hypothetical protein